MSRLIRYRESLTRFIKDKNSLITDKDINNHIDKSDLVFPIIALTTMNNQNKKYHLSMQGYYVASAIEFLNTLITILNIESNIGNNIENKNGTLLNNYHILINSAMMSFKYNLDSIKNVHAGEKFTNIILHSMEYFNEYVKTIMILNTYKPDIIDIKPHHDVINWYIKDNITLIESYKKSQFISKESIDQYIEYRYTKLCELTIILGWIMGGGDITKVKKLKKTAKYFSIIYKISLDFDTLEKDIININNVNKNKWNMILNYGLQKTYEEFLKYKEKFIEESMTQDIYTATFKEILDNIDTKIDVIIDQTSPDLKSTYSSSKGKKKK